MIKKSLVFAVVLAVVLLAMAAPAFAAGGMPAAHGVDGKTFGAAVSALAQSAPGAVAAHVSGAVASGGQGMPALHGVDGKTFGAAVSALAQSAPGAVAAHVSAK